MRVKPLHELSDCPQLTLFRWFVSLLPLSVGIKVECYNFPYYEGGGYCRLRYCCLESLDRELFV